jgi:hypothetical protein
MTNSYTFSSVNIVGKVRTALSRIDPKLLIFLILVLNIKLLFKVLAIVAIYIIRPNFRFKIKWSDSRLPIFYLLVAAIAVINFFLFGNYDEAKQYYVLAFGLGFWCASFLVIHQLQLFVEENDPEITHNTISLFFLCNALASVANYSMLVIETGAINVYQYQGDFQKYFISTGDMIRGLTFDTSTTNALLNALGVIYFLYRNKFLRCLLCMAVLLFTGSNFTNILIVSALLFVFCFKNNRIIKSIIIVCLVMLAVFLARISPQNNEYIIRVFKQISGKPITIDTSSISADDTIRRPLSFEERRTKIATDYLDSLSQELRKKRTRKTDTIASYIKTDILKTDLNAEEFQRKLDTTDLQKSLLLAYRKSYNASDSLSLGQQRSKLPGKLLAMKQTVNYLETHPTQIALGAGMGKFSSKLAFRATGLQIAGSYPKKLAVVEDRFSKNHLALWYNYFSRDIELHSVTNTSNSVYDQMLGEYGVIGLILLFSTYIFFFLKRVGRRSYAYPILIIMLGAFFMEYWFEQLSLVVIIELLLLLDIRNKKIIKLQNG